MNWFSCNMTKVHLQSYNNLQIIYSLKSTKLHNPQNYKTQPSSISNDPKPLSPAIPHLPSAFSSSLNPPNSAEYFPIDSQGDPHYFLMLIP